MSRKYHKKCVCEYNGTAYAGWQAQRRLPTVQETIEASLKILYSEDISIIGSGRTDSGVHAMGQVFSYSTDIFRDNHAIVQALNSTLPKDIAILSAEDVNEGFNAQFSAKSKTYKYVILNRQSRAGLDHNRVWFRRGYIDVDHLGSLLEVLRGTHDFTTFCAAKSLKENCVRTVNCTHAERDGDYIIIRINANGFLHNMVRIIVGTAVSFVFEGFHKEHMLEILLAKDRRLAGVTAPPQGLYLEKVFY